MRSSAGPSLVGLEVHWSFEQQNVWLGLVHFIMLPPQTLCDAQSSPLVFPQQLQCASGAIEVVLGYRLEHLLGQLNVTVLVVVVVISRRVVNRVNELIQFIPLRIRQQSRLLVPPREINIHARHLVCRAFVRVCRVPIQAVLPLVCCSDASTNTTRLRGNGSSVGVVQQWMDGWMAGVYEWESPSRWQNVFRRW